MDALPTRQTCSRGVGWQQEQSTLVFLSLGSHIYSSSLSSVAHSLHCCAPQKNHYRLDGTQELRGLGIANIAGAVFNS